ncbi:MAG: NTP transferase domain-containing protein [Solirubrobacterales bacterium]|nr:NTP transferase domain-containing protein [Solirubrobacterales bacterium]
MQTAILAGGLASRLGALAAQRPKYLLDVAGRPFADHQLAWLADSGVEGVVLCVGHLGDQIRAFVGDGERWGLAVTYVDDGPRLLGTAGALRAALDAGLLEPAFAVLYGDSYLELDPRSVWEDFEARRPSALMCTYRNRGRWDASNARVGGGLVTRYEKGLTDPAAAGMDQIDYGLAILDRDLVGAEIAAGQPADLADLYTRLAERGLLAAHEVGGRFYEIGSEQGLAELDALLRERAASEPPR